MVLISMVLPNVLSHVDSSPDFAALGLPLALLLFRDCEMHHAYMSNHVGDRAQNGTPL